MKELNDMKARPQTFRWLQAGGLTFALSLLATACATTPEAEPPDKPLEPTPGEEKDAIIGPGPHGTKVEGVAYPKSEKREGYGDIEEEESDTE